MTFAHPRILIAAAIVITASATPAAAQRGPSPEQQMIGLQQQLAAAQASAIRFEQRLGAIERQLQQIINSSETSAHRVSVLESAMQQLRTEQENRISALERSLAAAPAPAVAETPAPARDDEATASVRPQVGITEAQPIAATGEAPTDPGEDAYTEGFKLWEAERYDAAISSLRAFTAAFPRHRRVSWANNLTGRAYLDKGQPRAAAEVLLANYRTNPKGGRAQDSLYYLGQALMKLGQPQQACKAYAELTSVYGSAVRAELKPMIERAQAEANC
ncbi:MAG TPA: tetratricopeptide repeat protein [Sphingomicrobium sp.]|nr:tetratricopeptide repeat protein [Sphingomicrobium sp.]